MIKLKRPIIFYDLETTGTDLLKDRLTEIYAEKIYPDGTKKILHHFVNPGIPIPPFITALTGITDEQVKDCPMFEEIKMEIYDFMTGFQEDNDPDLSGFGINFFDNSFLAERFKDSDLIFPLPNQRSVDLSDIYKKKNPRSLSAAFKDYTGEEHTSAHTASGDIEACIKIFDCMVEVHSDIGSTIDEIHAFAVDGFKVVDVSRKLSKNDDGEIIFNIGKAKGQLVKDDIGFAEWMLSQNWITLNTAWYIKEELRKAGHPNYQNDEQENEDDLNWL